MPKYRSEDYDDYSVPPDKHKELSAKETMNRRGFDTIEKVQKQALRRGSIPACCTCGSYVEPDGKCPHGHPSILLKKKLI